MAHPWESSAWKELAAHAAKPRPHLRQLLADEKRCSGMVVEHNGIVLDYSRQLATPETMSLLLKLADQAQLKEKVQKMFNGVKINETENRAVLHVALRAAPDTKIIVDGTNVTPEVHAVLQKIKGFTEQIRSGKWVGATGKPLKDVLSIGIGGSYLGPLFVHTALETYSEAQKAASGRRVRFLANVDPEDVSRALNGLDPETTLAVVVSKTFTTAETMLNARTVKEWFVSKLGASAVAKHMVACSTALKLVEEFGINPSNAFGFWDWVGGRYSVTSAVGIVPLSLQYGFEIVEKFLAGCLDIDNHFRTAEPSKNLPILLGLLANWNTTFLNIPANAILPYCQGMAKLAPHIQQVSMESNGKGVALDGTSLPFPTGEIIFGEPGTNGQHSFYQLIHQGRLISCDFIGFCQGQQDVYVANEPVSNHDELMSNFFAQADALAVGKTKEELVAEGVPAQLISHKVFTGNRPSLSLLFPKLGPFEIGQILALYEHRVAVQGFLWGLNSFDQWGVELGKMLAKQVRTEITACRKDGKAVNEVGGKFNWSTRNLLHRYLNTLGGGPQHKLKYSDDFSGGQTFQHFTTGLEGTVFQEYGKK